MQVPPNGLNLKLLMHDTSPGPKGNTIQSLFVLQNLGRLKPPLTSLCCSFVKDSPKFLIDFNIIYEFKVSNVFYFKYD